MTGSAAWPQAGSGYRVLSEDSKLRAPGLLLPPFPARNSGSILRAVAQLRWKRLFVEHQQIPSTQSGTGRGRAVPRERPASGSSVFSFLLPLLDSYKGLLMTCEDILISRVPAAPAEEGCSPKGNFVFLGRTEHDTKASSGLCCCCAKCI